MMTNFPRRVLLLLALSAAGCDQNSGSISGTVTYNGEPVKMGTISFRPVGGAGQVFAGQITDGAYSIPKSTPGSRTVAIRGTKEVKWALSSEESARAAAEAQAAGKSLHVGDAADYIPEDAEGNNQTIEISDGDQTLDFELKGPPRK
jgi:hypothetical protein